MNELTQTTPKEENPALLYLLSLNTKQSRRTQGTVLTNMASIFGQTVESMPWGELRYQYCMVIFASLKEKEYSVAYINRHLSALKETLRHAWRLGQISEAELAKATDIKALKEDRVPHGMYISDDVMIKILDTCNLQSPFGLRAFIVIALLWQGGFRRSELANLQIEDYDEDSGRVTILKGKGNKERTIYISGDVKTILEEWLRLRGTDIGPVLTSLRGDYRQLGAQGVYDIVKKQCLEAGIPVITPHDFRRTFITNLILKGTDVILVSKLAGHTDPRTTKMYDMRDEFEKQKAAAQLELPRGIK